MVYLLYGVATSIDPIMLSFIEMHHLMVRTGRVFVLAVGNKYCVTLLAHLGRRHPAPLADYYSAHII